MELPYTTLFRYVNTAGIQIPRPCAEQIYQALDQEPSLVFLVSPSTENPIDEQSISNQKEYSWRRLFGSYTEELRSEFLQLDEPTRGEVLKDISALIQKYK